MTTQMNWRAVGAIARKDVKVALRTRGVVLPIVILPLIMLIILPGVIILLSTTPELAAESTGDLDQMFQAMPAAVRDELAGYAEAQRWVVVTALYLFAPLYLIVPLMVASVIAADSFAGEKERKTLEALLYTPTSDRELVVGKMLAAWLTALAVAVGGFVVYAIVVNAAAWPVMGRLFFPNLTWVLLVAWVSPAVAALGLGAIVLVSARVQGFQEANQIGGLVVVPLVLLVVGQAVGVIFLSTGIVVAIGLIVWAIALAILWIAERTFRRSEIIARL